MSMYVFMCIFCLFMRISCVSVCLCVSVMCMCLCKSLSVCMLHVCALWVNEYFVCAYVFHMQSVCPFVSVCVLSIS